MEGTPQPTGPRKPKRIRKKVKRNPDNKKLVCPDCGKKYYFNCQLNFHRLVHTGEKPYACNICGKAFNTQYSLKNHKYIHSDEKPFKCSFCKYACRDSSTLRKHHARHKGIETIYQCKVCDKTYKNKNRLKCHVAEDHLNVDLKKFPCPRCDKVFKTNARMKTHVKLVHDLAKSGHCPVCNLYITNLHNLDAHLSTHVDAKPYVCSAPGCKHAYKDRSSLKKHMVLHSPDDQFPCDICDRLFSRRIRLNRHILTVHGKRKCVECDYCGVRFYSKNYLIKHIKQKHAERRRKFVCDMCGFKTHNKPSIVMHIKHGHTSESDLMCKICHTVYKKHMYLKLHYKKTHKICYKTKTRPTLVIKEEPPDDDASVHSIDLFEIDKEEPGEESNPATDAAADLQTEVECVRLGTVVPEEMVHEYYTERVTRGDLKTKESAGPRSGKNVDKKAYQDQKKAKVKILEEARRRKAMEAMEKARLVYNEKISKFVNRTAKVAEEKQPIKVKFFKKKPEKCAKIEDKPKSSNSDCNKTEKQTNDNDDDEENVEKKDSTIINCNNTSPITDTDELNKTNDEKNLMDVDKKELADDDDVTSEDDKIMYEESDDDEDEDWSSTKKKKQVNRKVNFNSHQCYVCFKLYETKAQLLDHCKGHFDVCDANFLKKCPLCPYVTKQTIATHLRLRHGVTIKVPYSRIQDKKNNTDGCRYYLDIDDPLIHKMEVIPSVRNLNKIASMKIDKKRREDKDKTLARTKLVKKGKEWVVETEKIKIDKDVIMPEFDSDTMKNIDMRIGDSDGYFDSLKKMYHVAKKAGKTMLFPCQSCDKVCRNLAALKLHNRKHEANPKPFKKKVWKHKMKESDAKKRNATKTVKRDTTNRTAKPKPIKNKHKCDPELKDFYENNIRGGNIEFWQFLKIFNKMSRDNIKDFKDLEGKYEYGIPEHVEGGEIKDATTEEPKTEMDNHVHVNLTLNETSTSSKNEEKMPKKQTKVSKQLKLKERTKKMYKRVIIISKEDYIKRNLVKEQLREKYKRNSTLADVTSNSTDTVNSQ